MKNISRHPFKFPDIRRFTQQLANSTSDILYVMDLEKMRTIFINDRAADVLGNKNLFLEALNPADYLPRMKHFEACEYLNDDEIKEIEVRLKVKNGTWRWFRIKDFAFKRNINGIVYQVIGIVHDIHENKLAETTLARAQEKIKEEQKKSEDGRKLLQSVFNTLPVVILIYKAIRDQHNKIVDFRLETITPLSESDNKNLIQAEKKLLSTISSPQHEHFINGLIRAVEYDQPGEEVIHYHDNGYDNWYTIKYKKLDDGVIVTRMDVTATKKTEKELKESVHFIEQITNTTSDIIYVFDLQEKSIVFTNARAAQLLGYSVEHICSQGSTIFPQILHPDDFERRMEHMLACKLLKENEIKEIDIRLKVRNGCWHWFRIKDKAFKRDDAGNVTQTIGIGRDIHEQNLITLAVRRAKMQN